MRHFLLDRILLHLMRIGVFVMVFLLAQELLPTWWEMVQRRLVHVDYPVELIQNLKEQARLEGQFRRLSIALFMLLCFCFACIREQAYGIKRPKSVQEPLYLGPW